MALLDKLELLLTKKTLDAVKPTLLMGVVFIAT